MNYEQLIRSANRKRPKMTTITFGPWHRGLVTNRQAEQASPRSCIELVNLIVTPEGHLKTRPGITRRCFVTFSPSGRGGPIEYMTDCRVGGIHYMIASAFDSVGNVSGLFRCAGGISTQIATFTGDRELRFLSFADILIILDGIHVKYWDGATIGLLYDDGTAPDSTNYQFCHRWEPDNTTLTLGNGTNSAVVHQFTTENWEPGYQVPATRFFATLSIQGAGYTGADTPVYLEIYEQAGATPNLATDTRICQQVFVQYIASLTSTAQEHDILIAATLLSPNTDYYVALAYTGGDAVNHVRVHGTLQANAESGVWTGAYLPMTDRLPLFALRPGTQFRGRTAKYACVHNHRLWLVDDDRVWERLAAEYGY